MAELTAAMKNDTLNGRLFAYELESEAHLRGKLGYWLMVERRMIRATWPGPGEPDEFDYGRIRVALHAHDITFKETSRRFAASARPAPEQLSAAEWRFLADHFSGANDPTAQAILAKALSRREFL